jgi:hypothetical protein
VGLGDILGSVSPAFGMLSGKGLFGKLPLNDIGKAGLGGMLGLLLSQGKGGGDAMQPTLAPAQPLAHMSGPSVGDVAGSLPQLPAKPSLGQQLGGALQKASQGNGNYSAGLSASQAAPPMSASHSGLQAMLQALGIL